MIILSILTTSLIQFFLNGWEGVLFELGSERVDVGEARPCCGTLLLLLHTRADVACNLRLALRAIWPICNTNPQKVCVPNFLVLPNPQIRMDAYFLSPQKNRSSLFGLPVIVPCNAKTKKSQLYRAVWTQVARLLSPAPPGDAACKEGEPGNYPFELKMVQRDGVTCARCPWYRCVPCQQPSPEFCNNGAAVALGLRRCVHRT